jgi:hypothetical protein
MFIFYNITIDFAIQLTGYHYSVNVNLAKPQQAKEKINGKLQISVSGDNGMLSYINL